MPKDAIPRGSRRTEKGNESPSRVLQIFYYSKTSQERHSGHESSLFLWGGDGWYEAVSNASEARRLHESSVKGVREAGRGGTRFCDTDIFSRIQANYVTVFEGP